VSQLGVARPEVPSSLEDPDLPARAAPSEKFGTPLCAARISLGKVEMEWE
jgi:hypothetical protein